MCVMVYIASDCALATAPWNEAPGGFRLREEEYHRDVIRQHVSKPFIYSAVADGQCACAFQFNGSYNDDGEYVGQNSPEQLASRRALADVLSAALQHQPVVAVFVCWSGDESLPPKCHRRAQPVDFLRDPTLFNVGVLVVVSEAEGAAADRPRR
jgi:hypothetical protein